MSASPRKKKQGQVPHARSRFGDRTRLAQKGSHDISGRQRLWADEYLIDLNATQAAIRAGYTKGNARLAGYMNLGRPHVVEYLLVRMAERAKKCDISQERVVEEVKRLALASLRDILEWDADGVVRVKPSSEITPEAAAAISEIHATRTESPSGDITTNLRVKLHPKNEALKLLGQHLGLFTERHEHVMRGVIQQEHRHRLERSLKEMSPEEIVALRARLNQVLPVEAQAPRVAPKEL